MTTPPPFPLAPKAPAATPRKGDRTAAAILAAAEDLFAEKGFEGTTLRDVATRVGIRIPSLYNHFENKEALYGAVLERGLSPILQMLSTLVAKSEVADDTDQPDPRAIIEWIVAVLDARPQLPRLLLRETLAGGNRLTPELRDWIAPIFERAGEAAFRGAATTRWQPEQIPQLVLAIYHVVIGYYAIAPFYKQLSGQDLLAEDAHSQQTRFLSDFVETLFSPDPTR